jgi:hypothetical protein
MCVHCSACFSTLSFVKSNIRVLIPHCFFLCHENRWPAVKPVWQYIFEQRNYMHKATYHYNSSYSSSSGTSTSSESFSLLNYFLPLNQTLDAFCQITFFHNSLIFLYTIFPSMFGLPANLEDISFHSYNYLTVLSFVIWSTWPNQLNLWALM